MRINDKCAALVIGAIALVAYAIGAPSTVAFWDTAELQTVPYILGIAHPTACSTFVLLGWLFSHVWAFGTVAYRINLMCAFSVAGSVALLYATLRQLRQPAAISAICALGFAFASIVWQDATRAEVQDVALLFRVLALFFGVRWVTNGQDRNLFALATCGGLAFATHGLSVLAMPALGLFLLARRRSLRLRSFVLVGAGFAIGLLPYIYLPLRSMYVTAHSLDPTRTIGLPPGMSIWDSGHPATATGFIRLITGADFTVNSGFAGFLKVWLYPKFAWALVGRVFGSFSVVGLIAALLGTAVVVRMRPVRLEYWAILAAGLLPVPFTESYDVLADSNRYYLLPLWCTAVMIALGTGAVMARVSRGKHGLLYAALVASFVLAGVLRFPDTSTARPSDATPFIAEIKAITPDDALIGAQWSFATPLAYAAYVDRDLGNRIVFPAWPDEYASHYPSWLKLRPLYVVIPDHVPEIPSGTPEVPGYAFQRVGIHYNVFRVSKADTVPVDEIKPVR